MDREKLSENVRWVLYTSCSDQNVLNRIPLLTDDELRYCLLNEERKTGIRNLQREAKKRNFPAVSEPPCPIEQDNRQERETPVEPKEQKQLHLF